MSQAYAVSLSTAQVVAIALIALLTWTNARGLEYGRIIQNLFTTAKAAALLGLIALSFTLGWNPQAVADNLGAVWTPRGLTDVAPGINAATAFGLLVALCVAQTGALFSADAWNNITFTAGEVKNPRRNIPLSLALGTIIVIAVYLLANHAYLVTLPIDAIQRAPADQVATAALEVSLPGAGVLMAVAIAISTFGCNSRLILAAHAPITRWPATGCSSGRSGHSTRRRCRRQVFWCRRFGPQRWCCLAPTMSNTEPMATYGDLLTYIISAALTFPS